MYAHTQLSAPRSCVKGREALLLCPMRVRQALGGGVPGVLPGRAPNLAEALGQAPSRGLFSPVPSRPLLWLWPVEIGGESDTQPHSCSGALGHRSSLN